MEDVGGDERKEHGHGVEDVRVPLVLGDGALYARGELDEAVDVAVDDEGTDGVEEVEEAAGVDWGIEVLHVDALAAFGEGCLFLAEDFELEADAEGKEDADRKQLHANARHIDVQADLLRAGGLGRGRQRATGGLNEEGAHVAEDEDERDALRFEAKDAVVDEEEVGHATEDHVDEGVDPQGGEQDKELLRGRGGAVQLLLDANSAEDVPGCLPGTAHD